MCNLFFGTCSFLALGSPRGALAHDTAMCLLSPAQDSALGLFQRGYDRLARLGPVVAEGGRKPLKQRLHHLRLVEYGTCPAPPSSQPLNISDARLDFPERAGTVPLAKINSGLLRDALQDPSLILRDALEGGKMPRTCPPRPFDEWLRYMVRVQKAGGCVVLGRGEVLTDPDGHVAENGLFPSMEVRNS